MTETSESSEHERVADRVYSELRRLIVTGSLAPGTKVVEAELAELVDSSRTPVRLARQRLEQEGFLVSPARSLKRTSVKVAPLTPDDARELFYLMGQIEALAARSAAEMSDARRFGIVNQMKRWNQELADAKAVDRGVIFRADLAFHSTCVDEAGGERVRKLHASMKPQAERYIRVYINALSDTIGVSVAEHRKVIEAVEDGYAEDAEISMQANWRNAAGRFVEGIDAVGAFGAVQSEVR